MSLKTPKKSNIQERELKFPTGRVSADKTWTRPASWPAMPTVTTSDEKFVGLYAIFPDNPYVSFKFYSPNGGNLTVDWGDGTSESLASNTQVTHLYDYNDADLNSDTVATFGYKTAFITVTHSTGNLIEIGDLNLKPTGAGVNSEWSTGWLDIVMSSDAGVSNLTVFGTTQTSGAGATKHAYLERIRILKTTSIPVPSGVNFANINNLRVIELPSTFRPQNCTSFFLNCFNLIEAPTIDLSSCTAVGDMFRGATSLTKTPSYDLRACTTTSGMFYDCRNLREVGQLLTDNSLTNTSNMFRGCLSLRNAPWFDTQSVTNMSSMFQECRSLREIPFYNTQSVTNMSNMFYECRSIISVPKFNTASVTTMSAMFYSCQSLRSIPEFNTANVTTMSQTFYNCPSLNTIPLLNTSKVTTFSETFRLCAGLDTVPLLDTSNATTMANMFNSAYSLRSIPEFNTAKVTTLDSTFVECYGLTTVPALNTSNVTTMSSTFSFCRSLTDAPSFTDTSKVTNFTSMFNECTSLRSVPGYNTNAAITVGSMFVNCRSLQSIPSFNLVNCSGGIGEPRLLGTSTTNTGCASLYNLDAFNISKTFTVAGCNLVKARIEDVFNNLSKQSGVTITITSNPGSATFTKSCSTTSGSKDITVNTNTSLITGMYVTGTNLGPTKSVTFQDTGDTVTSTAHGLSDGKQVAFSAITSTTGISTYTTYYVVNATTDTFQLSTTEGGAALALTTNGSGTLMLVYKVTNISGTTVTLDAPATATGTAQSLVFRDLNVSLATFKGWTVSG